MFTWLPLSARALTSCPSTLRLMRVSGPSQCAVGSSEKGEEAHPVVATCAITPVRGWLGNASSTYHDEEATVSGASEDWEIDKPIFIKESMKLDPFQTQIIEYRTRPLLGESAHVMITPLKAGKVQPDGAWPQLLGLHVLPSLICLKVSSSKASVVVRNMSDNPIYL